MISIIFSTGHTRPIIFNRGKVLLLKSPHTQKNAGKNVKNYFFNSRSLSSEKKVSGRACYENMCLCVYFRANQGYVLVHMSKASFLLKERKSVRNNEGVSLAACLAHQDIPFSCLQGTLEKDFGKDNKTSSAACSALERTVEERTKR